MTRRTAIALIGLWAVPLGAQEVVLVPGFTREFRGLSSRGDEMWAAGRNGTYAHSRDGGHSWKAGVIPGADDLVLVDVEALGEDTACVLGTSFDNGLGRAYRTTDGGHSWTLTYELARPDAFLDGMAFWNRERGVAFGDPVDGAFVILRTDDGCQSWVGVAREHMPAPLHDEAGFAASGTAIAVAGTQWAWIGTGGDSVARVLRTHDGGRSWSAYATPMPGGAATGIFGIAFRDTLHGIAVGGNYQQPTGAGANVLVTSDGGRSWALAGTAMPAGVRYGASVLTAGARAFVAAGPTGIGVTLDDGTTWVAVDTLYGFAIHAVADRAWIAGPNGWIATFDLARFFSKTRPPDR